MRRSAVVLCVAGGAALAQQPPPEAASGPVPAALQGIPGMDFSSLPPPAQKELSTVLSDDFCYCGCPHALGACLRTHAGCKHAKRMARLAAAEAKQGTPASEISVHLSKYYLSFRGPRTAFKSDPRICQGAKSAPVTLVEFSDFECPFCAVARPMLEQLVADHPGKVRLCYAPFPLQQHENAIPAGQAALYARDKGKFWPMHNALFENQKRLSPDVIVELAGEVGLNKKEVDRLLISLKYQDELVASREAGRVAGVESTPTVFVSGRKLNLAITPETLAQTLEDELEWQAQKGAWVADDGT